MSLPLIPGLTMRRLQPDDLDATVSISAACERAVDGVALLTRDDLVASWSRPSFDISTMSVGVEHAGQLVATGEVLSDRAEVSVHPDWWERGIGTELARWTWQEADAQDQTSIGQTISDNHASAQRLFSALGYEVRWNSWILRKDLSVGVVVPESPNGISFRSVLPEDAQSLYRIVEDAFSEWPNRAPNPFENWKAADFDHPAARHDLSIVALAEGRPIGVGLALDYQDEADEGWVEQLAVDRMYRGRGVGAGILARMFAKFSQAGWPLAGLSTDSRTGALDLYLHLGMQIHSSYSRWSKTLD